MNDHLKISVRGLEFIMKWEGCVLTPYKDVAGLRTIGVGHLIMPHENFPDGVTITKEKALDILSRDVQKCENSIKANIKVPLTQNQFDALCSFGFNCGVMVYTKSGVARALAVGQYDQVPTKLLDWSKAKVNGILTVMPGLYNRRKAEGELFATPDYDKDFIFWQNVNVIKIQEMLKKLSLYNLKIDGLVGPGTKKGILQFASNNGISLQNVDEGITQFLIDALENQTKNL